MTLFAHSLTKRYGAAPEYEAVRDSSLTLQEGEFVSIIGRSGSGKSTLLAMLGALTPPTAGKLLLDGTDIWTLKETERAVCRSRHIGFVFQFPSLLSNLTVVDNVAVPALLGRTMEPEAAYARAYELLGRVGLSECADAYPAMISGGEQRRAVIARALINSPRLLLADEPTSDLDEDSEADIMDLFETLQRSEAFTFVLVTHNLAIARHATRTYEMRQGILAATDLPPVSVEVESRPRRFGPGKILAELEPEMPPAARVPIGFGANLWRSVQTLAIGGAVVFVCILLVD